MTINPISTIIGILKLLVDANKSLLDSLAFEIRIRATDFVYNVGALASSIHERTTNGTSNLAPRLLAAVASCGEGDQAGYDACNAFSEDNLTDACWIIFRPPGTCWNLAAIYRARCK